jgi:NAD(P)-dependent dehydrogenase (short-subunit alcohol dehydrogenase family)
MASAPRTIFITGAASGIGRETALLFAARGWFVGIADIDDRALAELRETLGRERCLPVVLDVTDVSSWQRAIETFAAATNGRLDVLFNNAGIARMGLNEAIDIRDQHRIVDTNLKGVLSGVAAALPLLKATPRSRIVTMSSTSSLYGIPELAVYSATKHAVRALTEALSLELERYGIEVCDIVAPYVWTPLVVAAERQAYSIATTGIRLRPEQIASVVWRAVHGNQLRWHVHALTHLLGFVFWLLPFARRPLVRRLCLSPGFRAGAPTR